MKGGKKWKWLPEGHTGSGGSEKGEATTMGASSLASQQQQKQQQQQQQQQEVLAYPPSRSGNMVEPRSCPKEPRNSIIGGSEVVRESPSESASSRDTWSTGERPAKRIKQQGQLQPQLQPEAKVKEVSGRDKSNGAAPPLRGASYCGSVKLQNIARDPIEAVARRLREQPSGAVEELKAELRDILGGARGAQQREEFSVLQKLVLGRADLSPEVLARAQRDQLEILTAIKTGIQAFLHEEISVTQATLIQVFFYKRCRNMACQNLLPGSDCRCEICSTKSGFCNICMCTICSKFDFDVNTCRWIGCDSCSHWTHTDCAIRVGQISMGGVGTGAGRAPEMIFHCGACKHISELLGWVKEVFRNCATDWGKEELMREFDSVRRIFHGSEDSKGKRLFWKSEELLERLRAGADCTVVRKDMQSFFQDLEAEDAKDPEGTKAIEAEETCRRIAEIVQDAVTKMEAVAVEKSHAYKKALAALETCDKELEEKRKELAEIEVERQKKQQRVQDMENILRLKQVEADMFQMKAEEARREAKNLQRMLTMRSEKEDDYKSSYLKLRLEEAEMERRYIFEKIQLQEHSRLHSDPAQMLMMCNIQDLLKRTSNTSMDHNKAESSAGSPT